MRGKLHYDHSQQSLRAVWRQRSVQAHATDRMFLRCGSQPGRISLREQSLSVSPFGRLSPPSFCANRRKGPRREGNFSAEDDCQQERPPGVSEQIISVPYKHHLGILRFHYNNSVDFDAYFHLNPDCFSCFSMI